MIKDRLKSIILLIQWLLRGRFIYINGMILQSKNQSFFSGNNSVSLATPEGLTRSNNHYHRCRSYAMERLLTTPEKRTTLRFEIATGDKCVDLSHRTLLSLSQFFMLSFFLFYFEIVLSCVACWFSVPPSFPSFQCFSIPFPDMSFSEPHSTCSSSTR